MIDRIVGRQVRPTVEAVRAERLLEWLAHGGQRSPFSPEQMPRDIGNFGVEELVHAADIVDPHDFQCRLQQPRKPREPVGDTGLQIDGVAMRAQRRP